MANQIVNAAPMVIEQGTQDLSTRQLPREPEAIPQHLPKFFLFTQKGPTEPQLVSGNEFQRVYGSESFDLRGKFANHATVTALAVNAKGNACMIERVIPEDAGPQANIVLWMDVLPASVDLYQRNIDGSIAVDALGDPIITGTGQGYKVKWVLTSYKSEVDAQNYGQLSITPGDQVEGGVQSQRYPMLEFKVASKGSDGNLAGIRMWSPTTKTVSAMPTKMMNASKAYPYFISVIRRPDALSSPKLVESLFGEQKKTITFKPGVVDPVTGQQLFIGDNFINAYQNLVDLRYPKQFGDFGDMKVYNDNFDTLLAMFQAAEVPYLDAQSDFSSDRQERHLFNILGGTNSAGVPYHSFIFVDAVNSVRMSEYTNIYASGGSDGTINDEIFATLVKNRMAAYADPNDPVQELAVNVESIIYDTGFPMETKYALCNFIALRRDTAVVLSTYEVGGQTMTASEEHSIAIALRTRLQMFPESDYFGTPVMRGMIVGRSGLIRNSVYTKRMPLTYEVAIKAATYMGSSNGRWKSGASFDGAPGSVVESMSDISITWVPAAVRNRNWDVGLNWVQAYDRRSYFFPALKTVYENDTSVLNSFMTVMAICQLNKIANAAWREYSGVSGLTNALLVKKTNDFVDNAVRNKFDGRFVVVPDAQITDMDNLRGFSWTLPIKIYANNMRTVMTTSVQAFRLSDLAA